MRSSALGAIVLLKSSPNTAIGEPENLSSPHPQIQSNGLTFHANYKPTYPKKVGSFILQPWYSDNRG